MDDYQDDRGEFSRWDWCDGRLEVRGRRKVPTCLDDEIRTSSVFEYCEHKEAEIDVKAYIRRKDGYRKTRLGK